MSKTMPIGGFWGPVRVPDTPYKGASKDLIQDEIYALIKEAGINYISFSKVSDKNSIKCNMFFLVMICTCTYIVSGYMADRRSAIATGMC